jgi:hypothetical protein
MDLPTRKPARDDLPVLAALARLAGAVIVVALAIAAAGGSVGLALVAWRWVVSLWT